MKHLHRWAWLFIVFYSANALAQDVGIDFETMPVGTKLTTATLWHPETTYIEEYVGKQDGFFVIQNFKLMEDGSTEPRNRVGYDQEGRMVSSTRKGKTNTYTPFSCHYAVGECSHTYKYYNSLTKKYVTNKGKFNNRLEGDMLIIGVIRSDGTMFEVPHNLGPHRLRLSNEHTNALGQPSGFRFIDLTFP